MDHSSAAAASRIRNKRAPQGTSGGESVTRYAHDPTGRVRVLPRLSLPNDISGFADELLPDQPTLQRQWSYRVAKRTFDVLLALIISPFLLPLALALVVLVKISSKGPVFYRQRRVGQNGRPFHLYKFRTMFHDSDWLLVSHLAAKPGARREWEQYYKLRVDPRVTRIGAALRRTSLDELPQLINVLAGHMSFVGPRPIVHEELPRYGQALPFYTAAKPGVTGLWQVSGRGKLSYETRVSLDVEYVSTWSFTKDLHVLMKTWAAVWRGEGAF
jgi:exopolysaccharide production protein ExoY